MEPASWQILLGIVVLPLVTLVGYWWTRRGGRESHEIEERRLEIDGLRAAVEAMQTALTSVRQDVTVTKLRVTELESRLESSEEYVTILLQHINDALPPPPPARPRSHPRTVPDGHA